MYYNTSFFLLDGIATSTGSHGVKTCYDENRAHKGSIKLLVMFKKRATLQFKGIYMKINMV